MTLGLYETKSRRRRRLRVVVAMWLAAGALIVAIGWYAYHTGSALARQEVQALSREIDGLNESVRRLETENDELRRLVAMEQRRTADWQQRYRKDVPQGETSELVALMRERLDAGIEPARLAFVVRNARKERSCDNERVTKRFIVKTPLYTGANDSVSFDNNLITVTGAGQTAADAAGNPEAWFDPAKPITLTFTEIGGKAHQVTKLLPIQHSVVVDATEYRFNVLEGSRAFINVTAERCRYP